MSLRQDLLAFRANNDLTQFELAKKINVSRDVIIKLESNKPIRPVTQRKIELYLENNAK